MSKAHRKSAGWPAQHAADIRTIIAAVVTGDSEAAALVAALQRLAPAPVPSVPTAKAWRRWEAALAGLDPAVGRALCIRLWTTATSDLARRDGQTAARLAYAALWGSAGVASDATCAWLAEVVEHYAQHADRAGVRCAIGVLGRIGTRAAVTHLRALKRLIKGKKIQRVLSKTLHQRARGCGLEDVPAGEWEVADSGLDSRNQLTWALGDYTVRLQLTSTGRVLQRFYRTNGHWQVPRLPKAVRTAAHETLVTVAETRRQVRRIYVEQRTHLEQALRDGRTWTLAAWHNSLGNDPILGELAARLIWETVVDDTVLYVRMDRQHGWVDAEDTAVALSWAARLTLAHPLQMPSAVHRAWHERLATAGIRQPFPQVARETHLITPAEEATGTYSNRFRGQVVTIAVVEQAITQRGWEGYVGTDSDLYQDYPAHGYRAIFDTVRDDRQQDDDTLTIDRVHFVRLAWVSGYWQPGSNPVPLRELPPLVFSEAMYEVHRLIRQGGRGLNTTLERRARRVSEVLPTLGLGERATLESYVVQVTGRLHRYRVQLSSGGVHLLPDERYICIVPGAASELPPLPFVEEEVKLAEILSKILLLAADDEIRDMVILNQLPEAAE